jgi:hypothetical protein
MVLEHDEFYPLLALSPRHFILNITRVFHKVQMAPCSTIFSDVINRY